MDLLAINTEGLDFPAVTAGQPYTLSVDARGTAGRNFAMYFQFLNASGSVLGTATLAATAITETFSRYTLTGTAPANAVKARVFAGRIFNNTAAAASIWLELDNAQFQEGSVATAYAPSAKLGLDAQATAVSSLDTRMTSAEGQIQAVSEKTDGVSARINPPMAGSTAVMAGSTAVMAGVWSVLSAAASDTLALAKRVDHAEASLGAASAVVQQTSEAQASLDGKLSAMWAVKLQVTQDGRYYAAGMGIGIENTPAGMQSQILFQADRFAVINTANGSISTPFVIQDGQVVINSAVISQADIINLIVTGVLQSANYVEGQSGIRINFVTGEYEMNGNVPGQGRKVDTHLGSKFYDGNNVLRVELGKLD